MRILSLPDVRAHASLVASAIRVQVSAVPRANDPAGSRAHVCFVCVCVCVCVAHATDLGPEVLLGWWCDFLNLLMEVREWWCVKKVS